MCFHIHIYFFLYFFHFLYNLLKFSFSFRCWLIYSTTFPVLTGIVLCAATAPGVVVVRHLRGLFERESVLCGGMRMEECWWRDAKLFAGVFFWFVIAPFVRLFCPCLFCTFTKRSCIHLDYPFSSFLTHYPHPQLIDRLLLAGIPDFNSMFWFTVIRILLLLEKWLFSSPFLTQNRLFIHLSICCSIFLPFITAFLWIFKKEEKNGFSYVAFNPKINQISIKWSSKSSYIRMDFQNTLNYQAKVLTSKYCRIHWIIKHEFLH